ncbi:retropepsin-like aspartic protease family protein [Facilibium subflavum]|uniref:retropepsin-like aspartic protease family protein n=1 Tax=Facilibium subflavum TaxID=2219058 RepID=UPI000E64FD05|nr:retropepsin-like aspartic protease [Facilibium subflavum]
MQKKFIYAFWIIIFLLITFIAHHYLNQKQKQQLTPKTTTQDQIRIVQLQAYNHQYKSFGQINGQPVKFLIDTGATSVSIPEKVANKIGLRKGFAMQANTPNGVIIVYYTKLDSLSIGSIMLYNIQANINPASNSDYVLLGISALKHIEMSQKNNVLTLKQYGP